MESSESEPVQEEKILGKFDDVESLSKSYQELQSRMGNSVRIPQEGSTAEEVRAFYQKMGMPESPSGYKVPEGYEDSFKDFQEIAHNANLTQQQFQSMAQMQEKMAEDQHKSLEESRLRIQSKWGDNYELSNEVASGAIEALRSNSEVLAKTLSDVDLRDEGAHELFTAIGELLMDGRSPNQGQEGGGNMAEDDHDTAIRVREIMKSKAFTDIRDPEHEKLKAEYYAKFSSLIEKGYNGVSDPRLKPNPFKDMQ